MMGYLVAKIVDANGGVELDRVGAFLGSLSGDFGGLEFGRA